MKRRDFVASVVAGGIAMPAMASQGHGHRAVNGPMANATVSFGAWPSDPPLDRTVAGPPRNVHLLFPQTATIKAGGSVNFVIAGLHQIAVYGPGTSPSDINVNLTQPMPGAPASLLVINDPANRIYRGPFPFALPRDRTEVVQFSAPGAAPGDLRIPAALRGRNVGLGEGAAVAASRWRSGRVPC